MKGLLTSLRTNATDRLKNPIIGAFVFAWCALNINGLVVFALADNEKKSIIASNKNWSSVDDLLCPLLIAIVYLIILPLLNLMYEFLNDGVFNSIRDKRKSKEDTLRFTRLKSTVSAKIEADESFIRSKKEKNIHDWVKEKAQFRKQIIHVKEKSSQHLASLSKAENELNRTKTLYKNQSETYEKRVEILNQKIAKIERHLKAPLVNNKWVIDDINEIKREFLIDQDIPF